MWKRKQAVIAWEWDLESFEEEEQPMPEYVAKQLYPRSSQSM